MEDQAMARSTRTKEKFYLLWVLANGFGWPLGWGIGQVVGRVVGVVAFSLALAATEALAEGAMPFAPNLADLSGQGWDLLAASVAAKLIEGAVMGAVVGVLQWLVLRRRLARAGWWVPANMAGWALGQAAGQVIFFRWLLDDRVLLSAAVWTATAGGVGGLIGTIQWFVLRRRSRRAGWWIPVSTLALAAGWSLPPLPLLWIQSFLMRPGGGEPFILAVILFALLALVGELIFWFVGGGLFGVVTGFPLSRLTRSPESK